MNVSQYWNVQQCEPPDGLAWVLLWRCHCSYFLTWPQHMYALQHVYANKVCCGTSLLRKKATGERGPATKLELKAMGDGGFVTRINYSHGWNSAIERGSRVWPWSLVIFLLSLFSCAVEPHSNPYKITPHHKHLPALYTNTGYLSVYFYYTYLSNSE